MFQDKLPPPDQEWLLLSFWLAPVLFKSLGVAKTTTVQDFISNSTSSSVNSIRQAISENVEELISGSGLFTLELLSAAACSLIIDRTRRFSEFLGIKYMHTTTSDDEYIQ